MSGVDIRPFHALHFDPARVSLDLVVAPPYDVIDSELRERLLRRSPYNVVGLILPGPGREGEAGTTLRGWLDDGIVLRESRPCMYWLKQAATGPDGVRRTRSGLIAALRLQPYSKSGVRRHEMTMNAPVQGRRELLHGLHANLSPIFMGYADPERRISTAFEPLAVEGAPLLHATDEEGTDHTLWRVCEGGAWTLAAGVLRNLPITIIDGHHRYEAALAYQAERRIADGDPLDNRRYDFAPVYLANEFDPGLELFPTHRIVSAIAPEVWQQLPDLLERDFDVTEVDSVETLDALVQRRDDARTFGIVRGDGTAPLHATLRDAASLPAMHETLSRLDVTTVGELVIDHLLGLSAAEVSRTDRIAYRQRASDAAALVAAAPPQTAIALLVPAPSVADVDAVAAAEQTMPPKSTFFYPKILDGMVFHSLDS